MKKTYMTPTMEVVKMQTEAIMNQVSGFNENLNDAGGDGGSALGRGGSDWDDDEY